MPTTSGSAWQQSWVYLVSGFRNLSTFHPILHDSKCWRKCLPCLAVLTPSCVLQFTCMEQQHGTRAGKPCPPSVPGSMRRSLRR